MEEMDTLIGENSDALFDPVSSPTVKFPDLKETYYKYESRKGGEAKQRIRNGIVKISIQTMQQICGILVWVIREAAIHILTPVAFPTESVKLSHVCGAKFEAIIDLDALYEDPETGKPVYKLFTYNCETLNKFKLIVQLKYVDDSVSDEMHSKPFFLKTERTAPPARELNIGRIVAGCGEFKRLVVQERFVPPPNQADIAYHFRLNDPNNCENFEEGDVIGFFEQDGGDTYIKRLTAENKDKIVHAGVISRSAFIEANRSPDEKESLDGPTDTVCVLGIVKVKVVGSVRAGERVYASNAYPGKAVPQSHLLLGLENKNEVLLGMALQSARPKSFDDIMLVRCWICVVLGVPSMEAKDEISELYHSQKIETRSEIKQASEKHLKRLFCCSSFLILMLVLFVIGVYQVFAAGSNFRYWLCKRGSLSGHGFNFTFTPLRDSLGRYHATGIEFRYEDLVDKMGSDVPVPKRIVNDSNPERAVSHYYLNVDRCAYGYAYGNVGNLFGGYRMIGGAKVFAINWNCSVVYWSGVNIWWTTYNTTSMLNCWPKMPYTV